MPLPEHRVVDMCVCVPGADTMLKCARISHAWITGERCFFHIYSTYISQHFDLVQGGLNLSAPRLPVDNQFVYFRLKLFL